jgi:Fe-S cluster assembly protein SufD
MKAVRDTEPKTESQLADFRFTSEMIPSVMDDQLRAYRRSAWEAYEAISFPNQKDEAWRRTDIRGLETTKFSLSTQSKDHADPSHPIKCLEMVNKGDAHAGQIVAGLSGYKRTLDADLEAQGVIFVDFRTAEAEHPDLLKSLLGRIVSPKEDKFTALAAALAQDGILLYVPENVVIKSPLHSLYCGSGEGMAFLNHLVIWLEAGAEVTFVHESASHKNDIAHSQLFHAGIVELHIGKGAHLNFVELQSWGDNVWSFTRERAHVLEDSKLDWIFGGMGSHLTKNFSDIHLVEPGAFARMSGFFFANGNQHFDHDTQQNHLAKNTTSDLLFKGALMDESRSVWQGMIYVAPGAIGTDGYQANRNLILNKGTRANSIPGLEILADDVRCTHGATVGKLDEDELFYLLSRGIPKNEAEQLIVTGFFAQIMERIPFDGVQERLLENIFDKMKVR